MNSKKFLKQLSHYFPAQIAPALINLLTIMILTRAFTVEEYGNYILITTIINFSVTVLTQWLLQSILFYRPKYIDENRLDEFDSYLFFLINMFTIIVMTITLTMCLFKIFINIPTIYIVMVLVILAQSIFTLEQVLLQSDMQSLKFTQRVFFSNIIRLCSIVFIVSFFKSVEFILLALFISYAIFVAPQFKQYLSVKKKKDNMIFLKKMLTYGLPMLGWFLCVSVMSLGDRFLIKFFHGSEAVGLYSGNYSIISASLGLVFAPLGMIIHPLLMKYAVDIEKNKQKVEVLISKFTTIYFLVGVPIIILVYSFREEIAHIFLGEKYIIASDLIPIVMIGLFLWNLAMVGHKGMEILKKTKFMFYFAVITCAISFILNIILVNEYSYMGAAYGNLIAFSFYSLCVYLYSRYSIRWKFDFKSIVAILGSGITTYLLFNYVGRYINDATFVMLISRLFILTLGILVMYSVTILILVKCRIINIKL